MNCWTHPIPVASYFSITNATLPEVKKKKKRLDVPCQYSRTVNQDIELKCFKEYVPNRVFHGIYVKISMHRQW